MIEEQTPNPPPPTVKKDRAQGRFAGWIDGAVDVFFKSLPKAAVPLPAKRFNDALRGPRARPGRQRRPRHSNRLTVSHRARRARRRKIQCR